MNLFEVDVKEDEPPILIMKINCFWHRQRRHGFVQSPSASTLYTKLVSVIDGMDLIPRQTTIRAFHGIRWSLLMDWVNCGINSPFKKFKNLNSLEITKSLSKSRIESWTASSRTSGSSPSRLENTQCDPSVSLDDPSRVGGLGPSHRLPSLPPSSIAARPVRK